MKKVDLINNIIDLIRGINVMLRYTPGINYYSFLLFKNVGFNVSIDVDDLDYLQNFTELKIPTIKEAASIMHDVNTIKYFRQDNDFYRQDGYYADYSAVKKDLKKKKTKELDKLCDDLSDMNHALSKASCALSAPDLTIKMKRELTIVLKFLLS